MTTLTCPCGRRLNVRGMPSGRGGHCPGCGEYLRVPDPGPTAPPPVLKVEDEWDWEGTYDVAASMPREDAAPSAAAPDYGWGAAYDLGESPPPPRADAEASEGVVTGSSFDGSDGAPPPVATKLVRPPIEDRPTSAPEPWFPPALLFPIRGMEGVVMVSSLGPAVWIIGTLVPEYCLGLMADAEKSGTPTMGLLVTLVTSIPVLLLAPLVATYWLQYLARVLISGAGGERTPPHPPNRNFDGLVSGMGSWLAWGVLGLGGGLLPLAIGWSAGVREPSRLVLLGGLGWPYAVMALLLSFLHHDDLAARPWWVIPALARGGPAFLALSTVVAGILGIAGGAYFLILQLRARAFWAYMLLGLPCGMIVVAMSLVAMHTLGAYHYAQVGRARRHARAGRKPKARPAG